MLLSAARCSCSLLQVLDDGADHQRPRATPSTSAMRWLIMTSNIGSEHLLDGVTGEVVVAVVPAVAIELVTNIGEG
jgi:ATP-dependent Clp protease ATP-binding subunit ClpA